MSFAENPQSNPYAAPVSKIEGAELGETSGYAGYSGFWRRVAAYLIDYILMIIVSALGGFVLGMLLVVLGGQNFAQQYGSIFGVLFGLVLGVFYYAGMESSASQATLGKQAMGIKVTDLYGRRISFGRAVGRLFAKILSGIILAIGFIMVAFTEKKQGLHDLIAGTLVLKTR